jgi:hypothetical protein
MAESKANQRRRNPPTLTNRALNTETKTESRRKGKRGLPAPVRSLRNQIYAEREADARIESARLALGSNPFKVIPQERIRNQKRDQDYREQAPLVSDNPENHAHSPKAGPQE